MRTHKSSFSSSTKLLVFELTKFKRMFVVRMWSVDNLSGVFVVMMVLCVSSSGLRAYDDVSQQAKLFHRRFLHYRESQTCHIILQISYSPFSQFRDRFKVETQRQAPENYTYTMLRLILQSTMAACATRNVWDELCAHYNYIHSHSHAKCMGIWNQHRHGGLLEGPTICQLIDLACAVNLFPKTQTLNCSNYAYVTYIYCWSSLYPYTNGATFYRPPARFLQVWTTVHISSPLSHEHCIFTARSIIAQYSFT